MARQGWRVHARNFRRHGFELDIIASKGATLVIVEVKALRREPYVGREVESLLGFRKRMALQRGAACAMTELQLDFAKLRFDLAIVVGIGTAEKETPPKAVKYFVSAIE